MTRSQIAFALFWIGIIWGGLALWYAFLDWRDRRRHKNDDEDEIARRSTRRM